VISGRQSVRLDPSSTSPSMTLPIRPRRGVGMRRSTGICGSLLGR
jgi:hypothetical protein